MKPKIDRIRRDIESLARITDRCSKGYTRISFSEEDRRARAFIRELMIKEADLDVHVDAAGNMIGRCNNENQLPSIMVGSHLDTVPGGGRFDGIAGVVAGLEVARLLKDHQIKLRHPLEVAVFLAEEPSPFSVSTIGSRALAGKLSPQDLFIKDSQGRTLYEGIKQMGGDPDHIEKALKSEKDIFLNLELHIEQGPVLYSSGINIGVVTGIAGIQRGRIEIKGRMDHSGTAPMNDRKDALTTASEIVLSLEEICRNIDGIVGTIGTLDLYPGATNVVPANVILGIEVRCLDNEKIDTALARFKAAVDRIRTEREIDIKLNVWPSSNPIKFQSSTFASLVDACKRSATPFLELQSGAGHDASHIAEIAPTGMIFIPCRKGRSHCPEEWCEFDHIGIGVEILTSTILAVDKE